MTNLQRKTGLHDAFRNLDYEERLTRLENALLDQANRHRLFNVSNATSIDLGTYDGDNITGLRISMSGRHHGQAGDTFIRLRPNGLIPVNVGNIFHRHLVNSTTPYAAVQDVLYGGAIVTGAGGFAICGAYYGSTGSYVHVDGTFFTARGHAQTRVWLGKAGSQDYVGDANRRTAMDTYGIWYDAGTPLTSLSLSCDTGQFSGKINVEIIP